MAAGTADAPKQGHGSASICRPSPGLPLRFGWSILSGAILAASFPPYHLSFLLPFGLAGFLASINGASVRHAAYLGFAFGMVFYSATLFWLFNLFGPAAVSM